MGPASGNPQVFTFTFNRVIDLLSVRNAYPAEVLQKFPRVAGITCPLVLIQDDLAVRIHSIGAVYPHIAFAPSRAAVLIYQNGSLIRLQYMVSIHFFVQIIIKDCKVPAGNLTHLQTSTAAGGILCDLKYEYDLNGNRTAKRGTMALPDGSGQIRSQLNIHNPSG